VLASINAGVAQIELTDFAMVGALPATQARFSQ